MTSVPFILALQVLCNNQWFESRGAFICKQNENEMNTVRLRVPLTRGQFSALDCNGVLTADGNVDDFNTDSIKEGFLWWSRKRIVPSKTPEFNFKRTSNHNDCSVNMAIAAEHAGAQQAVLQYETKGTYAPLHMDYSCGAAKYSTKDKYSPWSYGEGVGGCNALADSEMRFKVYVEKEHGIIDFISNCLPLGIDKVTFTSSDKGVVEYSTRVKPGICPMTVDYSYLNNGTMQRKKAKLMIVGNPRDGFGMDTPTIVQVSEGKYKVIKPLTATIVFAEAYEPQSIKWRSEAKETDFEFDLDKKFVGTLCVNAYSKDNAFEGACYTMPGLKDTAYTFK